MKIWWKIQSGRINALSLRERVFLFITLIVCLLALADIVWISPTQIAYRQTTLKLATQNEELQRLRVELGTLYSNGAGNASDPHKILRDEMTTTKARLQMLDQEIGAVTQRADGIPSIEQPLIEFLRRQDGLTLLGTHTLTTVTPFADQPTLFKRGLEVRMSGGYAHLNRYIHALELALPELRWGRLEIQIPTEVASSVVVQPELSVQVYVVGLTP